jgi:hypothetical protein
MTERVAILMGSGATFDTTMDAIPATVVNENLRLMRGTLSSLGAYRFRIHSLPLSPRRGDFLNELQKIQETATEPDKDILLLFYYFGHGFVHNGRLKLAFSDAAASVGTDRGLLDDVVADLLDTLKPKQLALIVDCCHANIAPVPYAVAISGVPYVRMTSTGTGLSWFKESGGEFTRQLNATLSGKLAPTLRNAKQNAITYQTWFDTAAVRVTRSTPEIDGPLAALKLRDWDWEPDPALNNGASQKSLYFKLYYVLGHLDESTGRTVADVRKRIISSKNQAFRISRFENGQPVLDYVSEGKVFQYVSLLADYGLARQGKGTQWQRTTMGSRAVANEGARYSEIVATAIFKRWEPLGLTRDLILSLIHVLIDRAVLPSTLNLLRQMRPLGIAAVKRKELRDGLSIIAYAGWLQRSTADTFFPI